MNISLNTHNAGYHDASAVLSLMHQVYQAAGRLSEWDALLRQLRLEHKLKRNLMAILRDLEKRLSQDHRQS
jgi:uncharacterized Zn finger protein